MTDNPTSKKSPFFWIVILAAVALALFLIVRFLFPQLIREFTGLLIGLFTVVTGLVFRKKRK